MAKKNSKARKPGGAARIQVIGDGLDHKEDAVSIDEPQSVAVEVARKPKRNSKAKDDRPSNGHFGVGDIKKAATFANSIGGLDKAIAVLQILKVAREVQ